MAESAKAAKDEQTKKRWSPGPFQKTHYQCNKVVYRDASHGYFTMLKRNADVLWQQLVNKGIVLTRNPRYQVHSQVNK